MTHHFTLYSFGGGSWKTAKVVQGNLKPGDHHRLVFTDTLYEDADTYRFGLEAAFSIFGRRANWLPKVQDFPDYRVPLDTPIEAYQGNPEWRAFLADLRERAAIRLPELVWLVEGRDPWEVFRDERFLGNSSVDPCSKILKRKSLDRWRAQWDRATSVFYVGIGEHEAHRYDDGQGGGIAPRMAEKGWNYQAPLVEPTAFNAASPLALMRAHGLEPARNYRLGYIHDNCGGFCCKAGIAHWRQRRRVHPDRFAYDSAMEQKMRTFLSADVSMLEDRRGGVRQPMTLETLAGRMDAEPQLGLFYAEGESGCGCMLDGDD